MAAGTLARSGRAKEREKLGKSDIETLSDVDNQASSKIAIDSYSADLHLEVAVISEPRRFAIVNARKRDR